MQDIFNLLPDVTDQQFVKCMHTKTNDQMLVVYLASLTRSVIALHNLINNKLTNRYFICVQFFMHPFSLMHHINHRDAERRKDEKDKEGKEKKEEKKEELAKDKSEKK